VQQVVAHVGQLGETAELETRLIDQRTCEQVMHMFRQQIDNLLIGY
jgi:hypothetical protein